MIETPISMASVGHVPQRSAWADWAGMTASIGCAIHCAAMPMVLAYLPAFGLEWLADEGFHRWMTLLCFGLAAGAYVPGWKKHGSFMPMMWGSVGLLLLTAAAFWLECDCCAKTSSEVEVTETATTLACSDPNCTHCLVVNEISDSQVTPPGFATRLTPLITPLGGIFLVIGHVVNHMKSCKCQGSNCCLSSIDSEFGKQ